MIEFKDVEIKYGDFIAVSDVNLTIEKGEFFTLLGPSGCGKTTTLRSLVGFNPPSSGDIMIDGKRVNNLPVEDRGIGMVFQSYALFPTMNVKDNITYGLKVRKVATDIIEKELKEIIEKVELTPEQLTKKVSELSGGQQQRVAIARALILKPEILVLDEPLSNLDASLRQQLRVELKRIQRELAITMIYVTHDQEEALTLSDHIAVFNKGEIEQVGTPKEIYNHSGTEFVCNFIGDINSLPATIITQVKNQVTSKLVDGKNGYIRLEKINTSAQVETRGFAKLRAIVKEREFFGNLSKYTLEIDGHLIKSLQLESSEVEHSVGEEIIVLVKPEHILQY